MIQFLFVINIMLVVYCQIINIYPDYGPALLDHCLLEVGFSENVKLGKGFNITEGNQDF